MNTKNPVRVGNIVAPTTIDYVWATTSDVVMDEDLMFRLVFYPFENREGKKIGTVLGQIEKIFTQNEYMNPWDRRGKAHISYIAKFGSLPHVRESMDKKIMRIRNLLYFDGKEVFSSLKNAPNTGAEIYFADKKILETFYPWRFPETISLGFAKGSKYAFPLILDWLCFMNTLIVAGIGHGKTHTAALLAIACHLAGKRVIIIDPSGQWAAAANPEVKKKPLAIDLSKFEPEVFDCSKIKMDIDDIITYYLFKVFNWQSIFPATSSDKIEKVLTNLQDLLRDYLNKKGSIDFLNFCHLLQVATTGDVPIDLASLKLPEVVQVWDDKAYAKKHLLRALTAIQRYKDDFEKKIKNKLANLITVGKIIETFESGKMVIVDLSGIKDREEQCLITNKIETALYNRAYEEFTKTKQEYVYNGCVFLEEAHRFIPEIPDPTEEQRKRCKETFVIGAREGRKAGLGHIFIDQRFIGLDKEAMQTQTLILGKVTTPGDVEKLGVTFGKSLMDAVQHTVHKKTFIVTGVASPLENLPCEIEIFKDEKELLEALKEFGGYEYERKVKS